MNARSLVRHAYTGRLPFRYSVETSISPSVLWREVEKSLLRSAESEIWPRNVELVAMDGLVLGARIRATYHFLILQKIFHYKITEYDPGRKITYVALQDHVFEGGATIELLSTDNGSILQWTGEYLFHPGAALAAAVFRFHFRRWFFRHLDQKIRNFENEVNQAAMVLN